MHKYKVGNDMKTQLWKNRGMKKSIETCQFPKINAGGGGEGGSQVNKKCRG